jgi:hypothetical protein
MAIERFPHRAGNINTIGRTVLLVHQITYLLPSLPLAAHVLLVAM